MVIRSHRKPRTGPDDMQITARVRGPVAIIDLEGRFVYGDGDADLLAEVQRQIDAGLTSVVLNMERVTFMDTAGLVALITSHKRVAQKGGALKILKPTRRTAELLDITKLTSILEVHQDEASVMASFGR